MNDAITIKRLQEQADVLAEAIVNANLTYQQEEDALGKLTELKTLLG